MKLQSYSMQLWSVVNDSVNQEIAFFVHFLNSAVVLGRHTPSVLHSAGLKTAEQVCMWKKVKKIQPSRKGQIKNSTLEGLANNSLFYIKIFIYYIICPAEPKSAKKKCLLFQVYQLWEGIRLM